MTGVVFRFLALWFVAAFACCGLYSYARDRRIEAALYTVACCSVFYMAGTAVTR